MTAEFWIEYKKIKEAHPELPTDVLRALTTFIELSKKETLTKAEATRKQERTIYVRKRFPGLIGEERDRQKTEEAQKRDDQHGVPVPPARFIQTYERVFRSTADNTVVKEIKINLLPSTPTSVTFQDFDYSSKLASMREELLQLLRREDHQSSSQSIIKLIL